MTQPTNGPARPDQNPTQPLPPPAGPASGRPTGPPPTAPPPAGPPPTAPPSAGTGPVLPPPPTETPGSTTGTGMSRLAGSATIARAILGVAVLALTVTALAVEENATRGYEDWTAWAVFATVVAAAHLFPLVSPLDDDDTWTVVAVATAGLVLYWVAIVVPGISSNLGFVQTLAVALAVAHCWLLPGRRL